MGGFMTNMKCVSGLSAVLHRAGLAADCEEFIVDITPSIVDGDKYTFAFPTSIYSFPMGYYDVDLYDGNLFKRRIRLNLHTSGLSGKSSSVEAECPKGRSVEPNINTVVECDRDPCAPLCEGDNGLTMSANACIEDCETEVIRTPMHEVKFHNIYGGTGNMNGRKETSASDRFKDAISGPREIEFSVRDLGISVADHYNSLFSSGILNIG